jgi:hypothetical protein
MKNLPQTYSTKKVLENPANKIAWLYAFCVREILQEEFEDVTIKPLIMESDFILAAYKGKSWRKEYGQHLRLIIESPKFSLEVNALDENTVDLYSIISNTKRQGIGNEVMLAVKEAADVFDVDVCLVPVAIKSTNNIHRAEKNAQWLRDWYEYKRFSECKDSPEMIYHANFLDKAITGDIYGRLKLKELEGAY